MYINCYHLSLKPILYSKNILVFKIEIIGTIANLMCSTFGRIENVRLRAGREMYKAVLDVE